LVYTFDRYRWAQIVEVAVGARIKLNSGKAEAKLFWNGRSQAVRLPKEFRFEGDSVHIRKVDGGVLLESKPKVPRTKESIDAWFARLDALRGNHLFPEREPQELPPVREYFD
jgi:antitoxin VapB